MSVAIPTQPHVDALAGEAHGLNAWVATVDHKRIGILYLVTALFFFGVGGVEALAIRLQLARPNSTLVSPEAFNQLFTMHGTTMIFLVVMPTLVGFGNYLVPLMIGARDMAFPRLNAHELLAVPVRRASFCTSACSRAARPRPGGSATRRSARRRSSSTHGTDYWVLALLVLGVGSVGDGDQLHRDDPHAARARA